jgi:hypothetical protein
MKTEHELPQPIQQYLRAVNEGDVAAFPSSFANDARVKDINREIVGLDAIKAWARTDIFDVQARLSPVKVTERDGRTVVTVEIDGTFDRSGLPEPLVMDQAFRIAGGKITELSVSFAS